MIVRQVEAIVHHHTGATVREMDRRSAQLRAQEYLPKGGHGRNAPAATPEHAANVLIGFFGTKTAMHAAKVIPTLANLIWRWEGPDGLFRQNFRTALAELLGNPKLAATCREIWICRDQPFAEIRPVPGTPAAARHRDIRFYPVGDSEIGDDGFPRNGLEFVRIPGDLIRDIANALAVKTSPDDAAPTKE